MKAVPGSLSLSPLQVLVVEQLKVKSEYYFAIIMDRAFMVSAYQCMFAKYIDTCV